MFGFALSLPLPLSLSGIFRRDNRNGYSIKRGIGLSFFSIICLLVKNFVLSFGALWRLCVCASVFVERKSLEPGMFCLLISEILIPFRERTEKRVFSPHRCGFEKSLARFHSGAEHSPCDCIGTEFDFNNVIKLTFSCIQPNVDLYPRASRGLLTNIYEHTFRFEMEMCFQ